MPGREFVINPSGIAWGATFKQTTKPIDHENNDQYRNDTNSGNENHSDSLPAAACRAYIVQYSMSGGGQERRGSGGGRYVRR